MTVEITYTNLRKALDGDCVQAALIEGCRNRYASFSFAVAIATPIHPAMTAWKTIGTVKKYT